MPFLASVLVYGKKGLINLTFRGIIIWKKGLFKKD